MGKYSNNTTIVEIFENFDKGNTIIFIIAGVKTKVGYYPEYFNVALNFEAGFVSRFNNKNKGEDIHQILYDQTVLYLIESIQPYFKEEIEDIDFIPFYLDHPISEKEYDQIELKVRRQLHKYETKEKNMMKMYIINNLTITGDSKEMNFLLKSTHRRFNLYNLLSSCKGLDVKQTKLKTLELMGRTDFLANENDKEISPAFEIERNSKGQISNIQVEFISFNFPPLKLFEIIQHYYPKLQFHLEYEYNSGKKNIASTKLKDGVPYFDISPYVFEKNWYINRLSDTIVLTLLHLKDFFQADF